MYESIAFIPAAEPLVFFYNANFYAGASQPLGLGESMLQQPPAYALVPVGGGHAEIVQLTAFSIPCQQRSIAQDSPRALTH